MSHERNESQSNEQEQTPYLLAVRYFGEAPAGRAYFQAQEIIRAADCDLSVFRFQLNRVWHVAVLGERPNEALDERIKATFSQGETTDVPEQILDLLRQRRARSTSQGTWVERHFRPGERL